jgi:hypothetical protein
MELFRVVLPWEKQPPLHPERKEPSQRKKGISRLAFATLVLFIFLGVIWFLVHPIARTPQTGCEIAAK